jgi:glycerol kinase
VDGGATVNNQLVQFQSDIETVKSFDPPSQKQPHWVPHTLLASCKLLEKYEEIQQQWQIDKSFSAMKDENEGTDKGCKGQ